MEAWRKHVTGLEALVLMRGPQKHRSALGRALLEEFRASLASPLKRPISPPKTNNSSDDIMSPRPQNIRPSDRQMASPRLGRHIQQPAPIRLRQRPRPSRTPRRNRPRKPIIRERRHPILFPPALPRHGHRPRHLVRRVHNPNALILLLAHTNDNPLRSTQLNPGPKRAT